MKPDRQSPNDIISLYSIKVAIRVYLFVRLVPLPTLNYPKLRNEFSYGFHYHVDSIFQKVFI